MKKNVQSTCLQNDTDDERNLQKDKHQNVNDAHPWQLGFLFFFMVLYLFPQFL